MSKSTKITLIFVLIYLIGILGFVTYINNGLNHSTSIDPPEDALGDLSAE